MNQDNPQKHPLKYQSFWLIAGLLLFLLGSVVGCSGQETAPAEIKIGVIAPISGNIPIVGQSTVNAAELAVKAVNEAGG
ncbi:MAG: hypothetical protein R3264_18985, partial [Anaerolineae bacterium]|nr:hypothetical protein [Anaerolineae bacterium]